MKHLTPAQIEELVTTWREQMRERDAEIRRKIEVGLHAHSLDSYADHCTAVSDVFESLLRQLTVSPVSREARETSPSSTARERAYAATAEAMTEGEDPDSDLLPIIDHESLVALDDLSQRDLAKNYLMAAMQHYEDRVSDSQSLTWTRASTGQAEPTAAVATPAASAEAPSSLTLHQAWVAYVEEQQHRKASWRAQVPEKATLAFNDLLQLIGDKPIREVSRTDCTRFVRFQENRPNGNVRKYRGVNALVLEKQVIADADKQSSTNASHKLVEIVRFLLWCEQEHLITKTPAANLAVAQGATNEVKPWSDDEIRSLLDPDNIWTHSGLSDERSSVQYLPWTLVLGAYTGARLTEIVEVRIQDFIRRDTKSQGKVPVMIVDEYEGKSVKTKSARRKIPLHPDLESLGLWDYIETRAARGETMLVDCPMKSGERGKSASQRFTRYTQRLGLHVERVKVFHSFRHAFKTKLEGYLTKSDVDLVLGHAREDSAGGTYTHPLDLPMHRHYEGLSKMRFDLNLEALRTFLAGPRAR